ncbi:MAG: PilT/PilU family type 4a pilus ATPase [Ectothiorhodospiraceae bacterium]|nr:PilT/PilU family type 4a pilus ATPase [Ectothiorhodospiraceae bacterium]
MARIDAFLKLGREQGCTDIHFAVGMPPLLRSLGELMPIKYRDLTDQELESLIYEILDLEQKAYFEKGKDVDFAYQSEEVGRFRVSLFRKISGIGAAFRLVNSDIPSLDDLGMPPAVRKFLDTNQGLVLVTGATGTGKSTTLASMLDLLNRTRRLNIITLEDPIEHIHTSQMSLVVQREIGTHVDSFANGLRAALREDPDVILVGELRDPETILMAMTAAETGHLVLGTLHTTSATKTLDRILDATPTSQKAQAGNFLSQHLRGVVSQKLVKTLDGRSRKAIVEIFINTPAVAKLINTGKIFLIPSILQTGRDKGMQLMDQALMEAVLSKEIDPDDAYLHATEKQQFQRFVTDTELLPQVDLAVF